MTERLSRRGGREGVKDGGETKNESASNPIDTQNAATNVEQMKL